MERKGWLYPFTLLIIFLLAVGPLTAKEATYCLSFKRVKFFPGERVSKFALHLVSGTIARLPRVPLDWQIIIDNEANWMAEISGNAIHGAADLAAHDLQADLLRVVGIPRELVKSGMPANMQVTGFLELSHGDAKRIVLVSNANVTLTPASRCGLKR